MAIDKRRRRPRQLPALRLQGPDGRFKRIVGFFGPLPPA
jgi:hypothetical protein